MSPGSLAMPSSRILKPSFTSGYRHLFTMSSDDIDVGLTLRVNEEINFDTSAEGTALGIRGGFGL